VVTLDYNEQVALITGASRGFGAALARSFAAAGTRVALAARSQSALEDVAAEIERSGGIAKAFPCDVKDWDAVEALVRRVVAEWGRIDVLVNAVGLQCNGSVEETSRSTALELLQVNYLGPLACCRAVLPVMRGQRSGHIVNIASVLGWRATPQRSAYAASKAALISLSDALRCEVAGSGILVTLICPGRLDTDQRSTKTRAAHAQSLDVAIDQIFRAIESGKRHVVLSNAARVLHWLGMLAPGLADRVILAQRRRERKMPG
jgi:NAD(P)-dependent dehydrogenase (short-subunit alcohol dehydrogenase family)